MSDVSSRIEISQLLKDENGEIVYLSINFGPHHFIDIGTLPLDEGLPRSTPDGIVPGGGTRPVLVALGTTHHGVRAAAGSLNSELERMIEELMTAHPDASF